MLLRQYGSRHQHRHLHPFVDRFESGPQGHLGLAVAHIAADEAIHRLGDFHIVFDFIDGAYLVGRFQVGERVLQIPLPGGVGAEAVAGRRFPGGVKTQQFLGDFPRRPLGPLLDALPLAAPQTGQRGRLVRGRHIKPQPVQLFRRHIKTVVAGVFQHQVLFLIARRFQLGNAGELGDAVVNMNHIGARRQVVQGHGCAQIPPGFGRTVAALLDGAEKLGVAVHRHGRAFAVALFPPALAQGAVEQIDPPGAGTRGQAVHQMRLHPGLLQQFAEPGGVLADGHHRAAFGHQSRRLAGEPVQPQLPIRPGQVRRGQVGQGQRQPAGIVIAAPAFQAYRGHAGAVHPPPQGSPVG